MKRMDLLILSLFILPLLGACGLQASPAPFTQTSGSLSATLEILPYPPPMMQETSLELTLRDTGGKPVSGAKVQFDLTMPGMEMPPNRPEAAEVGDGVYQAQAIFTMAGEWQIRIEVSHLGQGEEFIFRLHTK